LISIYEFDPKRKAREKRFAIVAAIAGAIYLIWAIIVFSNFPTATVLSGIPVFCLMVWGLNCIEIIGVNILGCYLTYNVKDEGSKNL
jgi:predicted membrane protein